MCNSFRICFWGRMFWVSVFKSMKMLMMLTNNYTEKSTHPFRRNKKQISIERINHIALVVINTFMDNWLVCEFNTTISTTRFFRGKTVRWSDIIEMESTFTIIHRDNKHFVNPGNFVKWIFYHFTFEETYSNAPLYILNIEIKLVEQCQIFEIENCSAIDRNESTGRKHFFYHLFNVSITQ